MHVFELSFVAAVLLAATPVLFASLAGALSAQVGVFNIALEGQMLWGAFAAVAGSYYTGNAWAGVVAAVVSTAVFSSALAVGSAWWKADPIVIAIGSNLFALGITGFLLRVLFDVSGSFSPRGLQGLDSMDWLAGRSFRSPSYSSSSSACGCSTPRTACDSVEWANIPRPRRASAPTSPSTSSG
jgi:ABC-type uncharacterized transport system permease subunit